MRHLSDRFVTVRDGWKKNQKCELAQLEALTKEGLTCREIAQKLDRSPAAIRNLRYKKHLVVKVQDETKALFQQKDELINTLKGLQREKRALAFEIDYLEGKKAGLQAATSTNKALLQENLAQKLMVLKIQRPDLFTNSDQKQIARLVGMFLKDILT